MLMTIAFEIISEYNKTHLSGFMYFETCFFGDLFLVFNTIR